MIIIGAGGFARELLDAIENSNSPIFFFDDITSPPPTQLYGTFEVLNSQEQVQEIFQNHSSFCLGIGKPKNRKSLLERFSKLGGVPKTIVSKNATVGKHDVVIGTGSTILATACISNSVSMGKGCLVYYQAVVTHDCTLGDYVELSPGATILGNCSIGNNTHIGANATILPGINVGDNCIVGAGAVVTKNLPKNSIAYGVPARLNNKT